MSFKNSIKLMIAKFSLVWSVLLYLFVVGAVMLLALYGLWKPVVDALASGGYLQMIHDILSGENTIIEIINQISDVVGNMTETIFKFPASIILSIVVITVIGRFLIGLKDLAVCAVADRYMSANMKYGFWEAFFSNFSRSWKLVLSRTLFTLPFDALVVVAMWLARLLLGAMSMTFLSPFVFVLIWIILVPCKKLFFSMWPAYMITERNHTFSAMRRGIKLAFKYSKRMYSNWVMWSLLSWVLNLIAGLFTFGVGLLITLPITLVTEQLLAMTILYNHTGRRYYLENGQIFTPEGAVFDDTDLTTCALGGGGDADASEMTAKLDDSPVKKSTERTKEKKQSKVAQNKAVETSKKSPKA